MSQIIIRPATLNDLDTLLGFEQDLIKAERPFDPTLKQGRIHYYDIEEMISAPHIQLLVAETDNKVVASGYSRIEESKPYLQHGHHAYLGFMYTLPEYRGKGINLKIMEALKSWSIAQNIHEFRLIVYSLNAPAIKAYQKAGFNEHMFEMRMTAQKD